MELEDFVEKALDTPQAAEKLGALMLNARRRMLYLWLAQVVQAAFYDHMLVADKHGHITRTRALLYDKLYIVGSGS